MSDKRIWFITCAARGMGVEFTRAALAAGNAVVATARGHHDAVAKAAGPSTDRMAAEARRDQPRGG